MTGGCEEDTSDALPDSTALVLLATWLTAIRRNPEASVDESMVLGGTEKGKREMTSEVKRGYELTLKGL